MNTVILTCTSLIDYVDEAQRSQNTKYPVVTVDRIFHKNPEQMKEKVIETINALDSTIDTVLVAMGFCGGSWDHVSVNRKVVIPRVDDCVSLLLHTDDGYHPNLKETGHLYMYEKDPDSFSIEKMMSECSADDEYKVWDTDTLFQMFFGSYNYLDIIDTGFNDCYTEEYVTKAQMQADQFHADLDYVPGSNLLLEKLVSGRWDEQFLIAAPGQTIKHGDFFE